MISHTIKDNELSSSDALYQNWIGTLEALPLPAPPRPPSFGKQMCKVFGDVSRNVDLAFKQCRAQEKYLISIQSHIFSDEGEFGEVRVMQYQETRSEA